ncbi:methylated-DNA--[protein]-cysteine S-methyltransferase [Salibacterium aidingense]|uniref:methylated-DNA--[protein]-cysteine S-methyltransferase n=1 Tax=Salibacterium aidingense TaxID=384933 RepID=UPI003BC194A7
MSQHHKQIVYWTMLSHHTWQMYMGATCNGLCYVGSPNQSLDALERWAERQFPDYDLLQDDLQLKPYASQFKQYLEKQRTSFELAIDLHGTTFQRSVWHVLSSIPYGQTMSYSEVAKHIQKPEATRAVSKAIGANPVLIAIPCHRVIGKNGGLTGYRGGLEMKTKLLELEEGKGALVE